jgi:hypothetical protein
MIVDASADRGEGIVMACQADASSANINSSQHRVIPSQIHKLPFSLHRPSGIKLVLQAAANRVSSRGSGILGSLAYGGYLIIYPTECKPAGCVKQR